MSLAGPSRHCRLDCTNFDPRQTQGRANDAAAALGDLENQLLAHQREVEQVGVKVSKAQARLEAARKTVGEWQASVDKLHEREREFSTRIDALQKAGVTLPTTI